MFMWSSGALITSTLPVYGGLVDKRFGGRPGLRRAARISVMANTHLAKG